MNEENVYICIHIYNGLLAIKKDEILPLVTTWMDLEVFMLSEISQMEKYKYRMISLICGILKTNKPNKTKINTENRLVVTRGEGVGGEQNGERGSTVLWKINF